MAHPARTTKGEWAPKDNPGPARTGRAGRGGQREQFGGVSLGLVVFIPTLHRPVRIRLH